MSFRKSLLVVLDQYFKRTDIDTILCACDINDCIIGGDYSGFFICKENVRYDNLLCSTPNFNYFRYIDRLSCDGCYKSDLDLDFAINKQIEQLKWDWIEYTDQLFNTNINKSYLNILYGFSEHTTLEKEIESIKNSNPFKTFALYNNSLYLSNNYKDWNNKFQELYNNINDNDYLLIIDYYKK